MTKYEPKKLIKNGIILVSHWPVVGQSLVSGKWRKVPCWQPLTVIDDTPISLTVYSVITLLRDKLDGG